MNIQINTTLLKPLLAKLYSIVNPVETIPSASMFLFEVTSQSTLLVTSTSLEIEMRTSLSDLKVKAQGRFLIPAKRLVDICQKSPDDETITIACDGKQTKVSSSVAKYQLNALPADDFPLLEKNDDGGESQQLKVRQDDIKYLFSKTFFSMADGDIMHVLNGLLFAVQKDAIEVVATDRHRLAVCKTATSGADQQPAVVLPRKAVLELQKLLTDGDQSAKITINSRFFEMDLGETTIKAKLIEGNYPDYQKVIPADFAQSIPVEVQEFKKTIERACVILQGEKKSATVQVVFGEKQAKVLASNQEGEQVETAQAIEYSGEPVSVGFNPKYLNELLAAVGSGQIIFDIKDASSGVLIREQASDMVKYVIMPVRL